MAEKGQPGGFMQPNGNLPSAPPSYQDTFGGQYGSQAPNQIPMGNNSAPYPTASGAPPYYQQGPQPGMTPYPNYPQPSYPPQNKGSPYPGGQYPNMPSGYPPNQAGPSPYPKVIISYMFVFKLFMLFFNKILKCIHEMLSFLGTVSNSLSSSSSSHGRWSI